MTTAHDTDFASHTLEDSMTTHNRTQPDSTVAYYLGRPAAFWRTALAPRSATDKSPSASRAPKERGSSDNHK